MRMVLLKEDYGMTLLAMTDCTNNELQAILNKVIENDENGIGETLTEICENLFPNATMIEIGDTDESKYTYLNDLDYKTVAHKDYYCFDIIVNSAE